MTMKPIDQLLKDTRTTVESHEWAVDAIKEAAVAASLKEYRERNSFPLRPSGALKSMRDLYYGLVNYYKPGAIEIDPPMNPILLELGHTIEGHVVNICGRVFKIEERNHKLKYGEIKKADGSVIELWGEIDFRLVSPKGESFIGDSKTCSKYAFEKTQLPKDEYMAQINLYLHSEWAKERTIKRGLIVPYLKDNSNFTLYTFNYNKELAEAVLHKFQTVYSMYERGELPPREHVLGLDWQADYSSFRTHDNAEFKTPVEEREVIEAVLPTISEKDLIRVIATSHGNKIIRDERDGYEYWLELGNKSLRLRERSI